MPPGEPPSARSTGDGSSVPRPVRPGTAPRAKMIFLPDPSARSGTAHTGDGFPRISDRFSFIFSATSGLFME